MNMDEELDAYQPSSITKKRAERQGEPIPTVHIPRKPHPNGLLIHLVTFQLATTIQSPIDPVEALPFILIMQPHLQYGDSGPQENFSDALETWSELSSSHFVADAAFGSWDVLQEVASKGASSTFSWSTKDTPWLWNLLSHGLPPNCWRVAVNAKKGCIASIHAVVSDKGRMVYQ